MEWFHVFAAAFNDFIDDIGVVDVPTTEKRFTQVDSMATKQSKLDHYFVSEDVIDTFDNLELVVLDKKC